VWGVGRGSTGGGVWEGAVPPPQNFFLIFHLKNSEFQCIMGSILSQFSCPFTAKTVFLASRSPELANESTACKERANGKTPVGDNICMK